MFDIIARSAIVNTLTARSGLSCGTCPGNNDLVIPGQFGLHIIVSKRSECLILFDLSFYIVNFLMYILFSIKMAPWKEK